MLRLFQILSTFPLVSVVMLLGSCQALAQNTVAAVQSKDKVIRVRPEVTPPSFLVLEPEQVLGKETFWDNRDWQWYKQNIPFFDCPDSDITTTYYYRWELLTKHLVYGSPKDGYTFTEFIDRPFWSGKYGAISCPAGHQLYESRWLRSPRVGFDFARYWFLTPGAQPRRYSCWISDGIAALNAVHPCPTLAEDLLPEMIKNYKGWEDRHFVSSQGMFWQNGHDDGMEFNINSRQSQDILRGAPGYRPTLNSYMWADAKAIAEFAMFNGKTDVAAEYSRKADAVKKNLQQSLWDEKRQFFLHRNQNKESRDGFEVAAGSLIYETGKYAGNDHGREEIGFVPWQFNLPDAGFEIAWKFLMDENYFAAKFGPRSVELNDPQYYLSPSCCWWSGQSWPYATAQTLKAMANLLQNYKQSYVSRADYIKLLGTFAKTHRKNGKPYIAEACHPDTGSWDGHDGFNHSEHYFHSSFVDLVLTGPVGIQTSGLGKFSVDPLATDWQYFAVDNLRYQGHDLCLVWDKTGERYGKGTGFRIYIDGKQNHHSSELKKVTLDLPSRTYASYLPESVNVAVNNSLKPYPRATASSTAASMATFKAIDGNYWYHELPPNRWTTALSESNEHWFELDFGRDRTFNSVVLYWLEDQLPSLVAIPERVRLETMVNDQWQPLEVDEPVNTTGHSANRYSCKLTVASRVRLLITGQPGKQVGLTEIEVWGPANQDLSEPPPPEGNLAAAREDEKYPKASASFTSPFDTVDEAVDGLLSFVPEPRNRWTCYQSPNAEDWFEVDFGGSKSFDRVEIGFFDDRGGVQSPESFQLEIWRDGKWTAITVGSQKPNKIVTTELIAIEFDRVEASKIRLVMKHRGKARSGLTEFRVWKD